MKGENLAGEYVRLKPETRSALTRSVRELRQRISCAEQQARFAGYNEVHQQLIWLEIEVRKYRDELFALQNQEELPIDGITEIKN